MSGWNEEIKKSLGGCGKNVRIGHNVIITQPQNVFLGDDVRIDPFTLITSKQKTGNFVHVCSHVVLGGSGYQVSLGDWAFVGYGSQLFTQSEDYSGHYGPVNEEWSGNKTDGGDIVFNEYSGVASGCIIFPRVVLPRGTCIGVRTTVRANRARRRLQEFKVYQGDNLDMICQRNEEKVIEVANERREQE